MDVRVNEFIDSWLGNRVMINQATEILDSRQAIFSAVTNLFVPGPCGTDGERAIMSL